MKLKETIWEYIKDEHKGAKDYKNLSNRLKNMNVNWALTVNKMAHDEVRHGHKLISIYKKLKKVM